MPNDEVFDDEPQPLWTPKLRRRAGMVLIGILVVVLMVVLPPYISLSRYKSRVISAMSAALGRPVRFDRISLHLLPLPGLTIENFVVSEIPDFGAEPAMRANTVEARLRFGSLWRRRIEVSRISLDAPSINLVRNPRTGKWNLQGIVMQASQISSAPTAQQQASEAPRFPYIEATGARLNIKNGDVKLPFSLKEAEFSLWLPQPDKWQLRLQGKPWRTDTDVSDVGVVHLEATLGRGADLSSAPIDLDASWKPTPMGEAAKLFVGTDLGWRGDMSASATLKGSLEKARLNTDLHLLSLHNADFVPEHTAEVNAHCEASATGLLRSLHDVRCAVPTKNDTSFLDTISFLRAEPALLSAHDMPDAAARPGVLLVRGEIPDTFTWSTASLQASLKDASPNYALAWMRLFSHRIPRTLSLGGSLNLTAWKEDTGAERSRWGTTIVCTCILPESAAAISASTESAATKAVDATTSSDASAVKSSATQTVDASRNVKNASTKTADDRHWNIVFTNVGSGDNAFLLDTVLTLTAYPTHPGNVSSNPSELPGEHLVSAAHAASKPPTQFIPTGKAVTGTLDRNGYHITFPSFAVVQQAASILPPLGDNLPVDIVGTELLQTSRTWSGAPSWMQTPPSPATKTKLRRHR